VVAGVAAYWALVQAERTIEDLKFSDQALQQVASTLNPKPHTQPPGSTITARLRARERDRERERVT